MSCVWVMLVDVVEIYDDLGTNTASSSAAAQTNAPKRLRQTLILKLSA